MSEGEKSPGQPDEPYDYRKLLRPGQRLVGPSTLEERISSTRDQAPKVQETVVRKIDGTPRTVPVVTQIGFDENLNEIHVKETMSTNSGKRELKPITPIEADNLNRSSQGFVDPELAKKAQRQRGAIRSSMNKRKNKNG